LRAPVAPETDGAGEAGRARSRAAVRPSSLAGGDGGAAADASDGGADGSSGAGGAEASGIAEAAEAAGATETLGLSARSTGAKARAPGRAIHPRIASAVTAANRAAPKSERRRARAAPKCASEGRAVRLAFNDSS
jgi:hypothetical protein